ncbi:LysR family transcriptional regulator [Microbacterium ureisolvens]|uniref:LysR family transcriptional regulator n=1 Tax=Microbacterium ureisolvens TaxID=2781186 RepID=A0ABS7HYC2_9MICO|nr:LysR family transcriptional regulator [Microbacterium ureisolvens]MBW9110377.1 LysR family transcriptional regulator [Microbacterium ureisolvens]
MEAVVAPVDYNLLKPLRALLEERNVTRAAARLHVSQPVMSSHLARLRAHYDDVLLVRRGNQHSLTPLAERLLAALPHVLAETEQFFRLQSRFDPVTSSRTFTIAGVDYAVARVAPTLSVLATREAPNIRFEFPPVDTRLVNRLPDSLRTLDAVILPHGYVVDQPHIDLPLERWVCLVDAASGISESPTADELLTRPWVQNLAAREDMNPARRQLQFRGIEISVAAVTPHFLVIPSLIVGTDRVAVVPEGLASMAVAMFPRLRVVLPPLDLAPVHDAFWWLADREHDAEHIWLRGLLARVAATII